MQTYVDINKAAQAKGETGPITSLSIWGLFDAPYLAETDYSYQMNGPYCGLFTELYQPKEQLERIFTHILEVRTERNRKLAQEWEDGQAKDTQSDPKLVFEQFFSQIQGRKLQEEEAAVLEEVFAKIREEEG